MNWFGVWSPTWALGGAVFMGLGFVAFARWSRFIAVARSRGESPQSFKRITEFFAEDTMVGQQWSNKRVVTVMWIGGLLSMISVGIGNSQANAPCVDACKEDGWASGRLRGDPHAAPGGPYVYECWCNNGSEWSEVPIEEARLQP